MSETPTIPRIPLRGDVAIPQLGFGVFQVPPEDTADVATRALLAGYRHIDTAAGYQNEAGVGQAVHAAGSVALIVLADVVGCHQINGARAHDSYTFP